MARSKIDILISARDQASKKLKKIQGLAGKMGKAFVAGGAIAGVALVGLTAKMISMAAEEERVTAITKNLLQKQGVSWDEVGAKTDKYLKKLEALTSFNDTELQEAFNELISSGVDYKTALSAMTQVTDLAVAKNIDLKTSAQLLGKAYVGQTGSLSRYGIILDVTKKLTEEQIRAIKDQNQVITDTRGKFSKAFRTLMTQESGLRSLQDAYRDTTAEIEGMGFALDDMSDDMEQNRIKIQELRLTARKQGRELTEEELADIDAIELANDELSLSFNKLKFAQSEVQEGAAEQIKTMDAQKEAIKGTKAELDFQKESITVVKDELKAMTKEFGETSNMDKFDTLMDQITDTMGGTAEAAGQTLEGQMANLKNQIFNVAERIGDKLIPALTPLIKDMGEKLPGAMEKVDKAFVRVTELMDENSETIDKLKQVAIIAFEAVEVAVETMANIWESNFLGIQDGVGLLVDALDGFLDAIIFVSDNWDDMINSIASGLLKIPGVEGFLTGGISGAVSSLNPFNDFIIRPGQAPMAFSPQDTVIGFKGSSPPGGMGGGSFTINSLVINGASPTETRGAILEAWNEIRGKSQTNIVGV